MVSYDQLKADVASNVVALPLEDLHHLVKLIAAKLLPSHKTLPPLRAIHNCQGVADVLQLLEKWALLSPNKVDVLGHTFNDFRLCSPQLLHAYKLSLPPTRGLGSGCPCGTLPSMVAALPPSVARAQDLPREYWLMTDYLSDVLGSRWRDLGRQLPGASNDARNIGEDHTLDTKTKIIKLLEQHYHRNPSNAVQSLLDTLTYCKLKRKRDYITANILSRPSEADLRYSLDRGLPG